MISLPRILYRRFSISFWNLQSRNCQDKEHQHCNGVLKFADPDDSTLDVSYPCECACHRNQDYTKLELYAWIGEDELGSGELGIKQGMVPAGMIPIVSVSREKAEKYFHQAEAQAARYGKRIRLCRFVFAEVIKQTEHGS
jgi:hypothetical protein